MGLKISETTQDHSILRGFFRTLCEPQQLNTRRPAFIPQIHFIKDKTSNDFNTFSQIVFAGNTADSILSDDVPEQCTDERTNH